MTKELLKTLDGAQVMIANKTYTVKIVPNYAQKTDNRGEILYRENIINIDPVMAEHPVELLEVLFHEIQHGIYERYGLRDLSDEESFVRLQAIALSKVLVDTPWLGKFIFNVLSEQK